MGQRGRPRHPELLTPREQEVLQHVRGGLTNEEIAERLGVSFNTVKTHVATILSKLGAATREEAAAWRGEAPGEHRWTFPRVIMALTGAAVVGSTMAGIAILGWGVMFAGGDEGTDAAEHSVANPTSTEAATAAPWQSVVIGSPDEAIARAHHDIEEVYGAGQAETTAEHMLAWQAAELVAAEGLMEIPLMPDGYECPGSCPAPGLPKNEPGYPVMTRGSDGPYTATNPEPVLVTWISDYGGYLGINVQLRFVDDAGQVHSWRPD